jgi:hypothetical protein
VACSADRELTHTTCVVTHTSRWSPADTTDLGATLYILGFYLMSPRSLMVCFEIRGSRQAPGPELTVVTVSACSRMF